MNFRKWFADAKYFKAVIIIAVATFFIELGFSIVNISALPVYMNNELRAVQFLGIILGVQFVADTISRPFLGALGDRVGRRLLIIIGPVLTGITALVTVHIPLEWLFFLRLVDGLAAGALWTCVYAQTSDITSKEHRNTAMSIVNVGYIGALALGPLFGGLASSFGKKFLHPTEPSFILAAIIFFLGSVIAYFIFKPVKISNNGNEENLRSASPFKLRNLLYTFRNFPEMIVLATLIFFAVGLVGPLAKIYAIDRYGISELNFGYILAPVALALGALAVPLSKIANRLGEKRAFFWGLVLSFAAIWEITYAPTIFLAMFGAAIFGLGFVISFPAWLSFISKLAPSHRKGEVLGVIGLGQGMGILLGSALSGVAFGVENFFFPTISLTSINLPFFIAALLMTFAVIFSYFWVYRRSEN